MRNPHARIQLVIVGILFVSSDTKTWKVFNELLQSYIFFLRLFSLCWTNTSPFDIYLVMQKQRPYCLTCWRLWLFHLVLSLSYKYCVKSGERNDWKSSHRSRSGNYKISQIFNIRICCRFAMRGKRSSLRIGTISKYPCPWNIH